MERFSVLMSVYYKENPIFFDLALSSNLETPTLRPSELVLICDGELTPALEAVLSKYQDKYPDILHVFRKESGGLGKALNFGLTKCQYDLIARSDSDDVCVKDRFQLQVNYMETHTDIAVVGGSIQEFKEDPKTPFRRKDNPTTPEAAYKKAKISNPLNHMTVMFRRDVILSLGSYRDVPYLEDYDLWIRLLIAGYKVSNIGEILVFARVGNGMAARRSNIKQIEGWRKISANMLSNGMINKIEYYRNIIYIKGFVYMPVSFKEFFYNTILRKK